MDFSPTDIHAKKGYVRQLQIVQMDASRISGRIIIIGDVHGCLNELKELLCQCQYVQGKDLVIMVGDYINKGPDSTGVIKYCMEIGAYGVLGNHDLTALSLRIDHSSSSNNTKSTFTPVNNRKGKPSGFEARSRMDPLNILAQELPQECIDYLSRLPHVINIPLYNICVVHAGIDPDVQMEDQDIFDLMHARRLVQSSSGRRVCLTRGDGGLPWAKSYSNAGKGPKLIFGHDAKAGFQDEACAMGLDTGCCYGGSLTAAIYPGSHIVEVPSRVRPDEVAKARIAGGSPGASPAMMEISATLKDQQLRAFAESITANNRNKTDNLAIAQQQLNARNRMTPTPRSSQLPGLTTASNANSSNSPSSIGASPSQGVKNVTEMFKFLSGGHNAATAETTAAASTAATTTITSSSSSRTNSYVASSLAALAAAHRPSISSDNQYVSYSNNTNNTNSNDAASTSSLCEWLTVLVESGEVMAVSVIAASTTTQQSWQTLVDGSSVPVSVWERLLEEAGKTLVGHPLHSRAEDVARLMTDVLDAQGSGITTSVLSDVADMTSKLKKLSKAETTLRTTTINKIDAQIRRAKISQGSR